MQLCATPAAPMPMLPPFLRMAASATLHAAPLSHLAMLQVGRRVSSLLEQELALPGFMAVGAGVCTDHGEFRGKPAHEALNQHVQSMLPVEDGLLGVIMQTQVLLA